MLGILTALLYIRVYFNEYCSQKNRQLTNVYIIDRDGLQNMFIPSKSHTLSILAQSIVSPKNEIVDDQGQFLKNSPGSTCPESSVKADY